MTNLNTDNEDFVPMGSMTLLNACGDVTICWDESNSSRMHELIEKKLKEGYSFFILEPKLFGLYNTKVKVLSIDQIKMGSKLVLQDEDAIRLFSENKVKVTKRDKGDNAVSHRSENADEILASKSLAVKPIAAG